MSPVQADRTESPEYYKARPIHVTNEIYDCLKEVMGTKEFAAGDDEVSPLQAFENTPFVRLGDGKNVHFLDITGILVQFYFGLDEVKENKTREKVMTKTIPKIKKFVSEARAYYRETGKVKIYGDKDQMRGFAARPAYEYAGEA